MASEATFFTRYYLSTFVLESESRLCSTVKLTCVEFDVDSREEELFWHVTDRELQNTAEHRRFFAGTILEPTENVTL